MTPEKSTHPVHAFISRNAMALLGGFTGTLCMMSITLPLFDTVKPCFFHRETITNMANLRNIFAQAIRGTAYVVVTQHASWAEKQIFAFGALGAATSALTTPKTGTLLHSLGIGLFIGTIPVMIRLLSQKS